MNNKLAIVNKGDPKKGKTSSINEVWTLLHNMPDIKIKPIEPKKEFYGGKDFTSIIEIRHVKIGICSFGDGEVDLKAAIDHFIKKENDCSIMVLACRRKGSKTYNVVKNLESQDWKICWEQNKRSKDSNKFDKYNKEYAKRVVDMIIERISEMNKMKEMSCI